MRWDGRSRRRASRSTSPWPQLFDQVTGVWEPPGTPRLFEGTIRAKRPWRTAGMISFQAGYHGCFATLTTSLMSAVTSKVHLNGCRFTLVRHHASDHPNLAPHFLGFSRAHLGTSVAVQVGPVGGHISYLQYLAQASAFESLVCLTLRVLILQIPLYVKAEILVTCCLTFNS